MPTDTPDPNRYCPECERWRSPAPYCPECKCKTRDATEQELAEAEIPDGSLAFGRYVVEGSNVYEVLQAGDKWAAGDQTQWKDQRDGDVWESFSADGVDLGWTITRGEAAQLNIRRPLPSTPATYAILQAAWQEHFRVQVGTRVRISREWSEKGDLSFIHPHYEMLNMVGSEQFVKEIDPGGVKLEDWWFPFHVLTVLPEVSQPAEAREVCKVPPSGWSCTRPAGHDGPCAAVPCESSKASVESALAQLEEIVCTADPDKGVVMLSNDGPCDWDPELKVHVYRHEHFSPLGDALIALHQTLLADHQLACDKAAELTALRTENAALARDLKNLRTFVEQPKMVGIGHPEACDDFRVVRDFIGSAKKNNAALAETVAGMREAVNDELAEAVALLETICGQEIQKQAGLDPGGRSTLELAEEAIALIAEKQRREGDSDVASN